MTECSICGTDEPSEIVMEGVFGVLPVAFCCWCFACLDDMARQLWYEDWKLEEEE